MRRAALPLIAWLAACGGEEPPTPHPTTSLEFSFSASAPCAAAIPSPNDLFADDALRNPQGACAAPGDPVEAAIAQVLADDGWALDAPIVAPYSGQALRASSLSSSVAFALTGAATSSTAALPPVLLFEQVGSATVASGWRALAVSATDESGRVRLQPGAALTPGRRHVAVLTAAVRNSVGLGLDAAPLARQLLATSPIVAAGALDAASAALLERERSRLAGLVELLGAASPPLPRDKIIAIWGFTTRLGYARLERELGAYQAAAARDRFPLQVATTGGDLRPQDLDPLYVDMCPPGRTVPGCYDRVRAFRRGVVKVPKVLDDAGHFRSGWASTAVEMIDLPFLASIPETTPAGGSPVAILLSGHGRSRVDARALANEYSARLGGGVVIAVDLFGHGERTIDPATRAAALEDARANSANPELDPNTPDTIPDRSGDGMFSGDPRALRDGQIAAAVELLHLLEVLKEKAPFVAQGIEPDGRPVHVVAQGHSAHVALHAIAFTGLVRTAVFPAGGAGVKELIAGGPASLKAGFLAKAPAGVTSDNLDGYLDRLEATVLASVSIETSGARAAERLIRGMPAPRALLPHGERPREVSAAARARLVAALGLPTTRTSQHRGMCDGFFVFTCTTGDQFSWVAGARNQMATFASSGGVTVVAPAP